MANPVCEVFLTDAPLEPVALPTDGSGAILDFFGAVRLMENGHELSGIDYEAHREMAAHQLESIAREAATKFGLNSAIVRHRLGFVPVGEPSVFVRTASRNRGECYRANEWIMAELKERVPIWKRPRFKTAEPNRMGADTVSIR